MNKDCKLASDRLKEALARADMKPAELADRSGINRGTISQYYNGKHIPTNINASKIAKVLHVDPAWLMGLPPATDYLDFPISAGGMGDVPVTITVTEHERLVLLGYRKAEEVIRNAIDAILHIEKKEKLSILEDRREA